MRGEVGCAHAIAGAVPWPPDRSREGPQHTLSSEGDRDGKTLLTLPNPSSDTSMSAPVDSDLESVLHAWPTLPLQFRKAILALIESDSTR